MSGERFKALTLEEMSGEQRRVAESILAGPRKALRGPFSALLYSPGMGDRAQKLGEEVRFRNSLPAPLKELAILTVARHWTAQYEWYAHRRLALEAGLDAAIIDAIAQGKCPAKLSPDEAAIYAFASELLAAKEVSDATFAGVQQRFGEQGVVDLICTMGYYSLVSMTLNVNRYPLPDGAEPLKKLG
jgi:4-carboxymuconolactone decarboxylase